MTTDTKITAQAPMDHPVWCQPARCLTVGGEAIHQHLFGAVAGVAVTVERVDAVTDRGKVDRGKTQAFARSDSAVQLTIAQMEQLSKLHHAAAVFANQRMAG